MLKSILSYIPRYFKPNYYLGEYMGRWMLPSLGYTDEGTYSYKDFKGKRYHKIRPQPSDRVSMKNFKVASTGEATLDCAELEFIHSKPKKKVHPSKQKVIIFAVGRSGVYENHIREYIKTARYFRNNCKIVAFNFRGVMASTGKPNCEQDWIDDCKSMVNHFRKQGIPLRNIMLNGHSMGGALTALACAEIYQEEKNKLIAAKKDPAKASSPLHFNNRSYSTMAREVIYSFGGSIVSGLVGAALYGGMAWMFGAASSIVFGIAAFNIGLGLFTKTMAQELIIPWGEMLSWALSGRFDALSAYKSLPDKAKDYVMAQGDSIIVNKGSLHDGLKKERTEIKKDLRAKIQNPNYSSRFIKSLKNKLLNLKDSKIKCLEDFPKNKAGYKAHTLPLFRMTTYHKERGRDGQPRQKNANTVMFSKIERLFNQNRKVKKNNF